MASQPSKVGRVFFLRWVLATIVGATVSGLIYYIVFLYIISIFPRGFPATGVGSAKISYHLMPSVITGALIGFAQWLVLRRLLPKSGWWVLATLLAYVPRLTGTLLQIEYGELRGLWATLTLAPPVTGDIHFGYGEPPAAYALVALAAILLPQWLVLRRHLSQSSLWIIVALIAYLPFLLESEVSKYIIYNYTVYTLMTPPERSLSMRELTVIITLLAFMVFLLYGLITGTAMTWLLRKNAARLAGKLEEIENRRPWWKLWNSFSRTRKPRYLSRFLL